MGDCPRFYPGSLDKEPTANMHWTNPLGRHLTLLRNLARRVVVTALGALCPRPPAAPPQVPGPTRFRATNQALRFDDLTETIRFRHTAERITYQAEVS